MKLISCLSFFAAAMILLTGFVAVKNNERYKIEGVVVSEKTKKPVVNALVFVREGEEEALTNSKGEFKVETTQKPPFVLTVEKSDHEKVKLTVTDIGSKLYIRLKPK